MVSTGEEVVSSKRESIVLACVQAAARTIRALAGMHEEEMVRGKREPEKQA